MKKANWLFDYRWDLKIYMISQIVWKLHSGAFGEITLFELLVALSPLALHSSRLRWQQSSARANCDVRSQALATDK